MIKRDKTKYRDIFIFHINGQYIESLLIRDCARLYAGGKARSVYKCIRNGNPYKGQYYFSFDKNFQPKIKEQIKAFDLTGEELHCNKCNQDKPVSCFNKRNDRRGKYYQPCRDCKNEYEKWRRMKGINKQNTFFSEDMFSGIEDYFNKGNAKRCIVL